MLTFYDLRGVFATEVDTGDVTVTQLHTLEVRFPDLAKFLEKEIDPDKIDAAHHIDDQTAMETIFDAAIAEFDFIASDEAKKDCLDHHPELAGQIHFHNE